MATSRVSLLGTLPDWPLGINHESNPLMTQTKKLRSREEQGHASQSQSRPVAALDGAGPSALWGICPLFGFRLRGQLWAEQELKSSVMGAGRSPTRSEAEGSQDLLPLSLENQFAAQRLFGIPVV